MPIANTEDISIDTAELVAKCCICGTIKAVRTNKAFDFNHLKRYYWSTLINDMWHIDHAGHWYCPKCKDKK